MVSRSFYSTLFLLFSASILSAQNTPGNVSFAFTTVSNNAAFSPKHVLAVWVEHSNGSFVKTLKLNADKRKQYLYTWNTASSGNTTDAITGATLTSHQSHSLSWNVTDVSRNVTADGDYKMRVEYTSEHAQGPLLTVNFTKNNNSLSLNPSDATYFKTISLGWIPESTAGISHKAVATQPRIWPNPVIDLLNIEIYSQMDQEISISIYDTGLKKILSIFEGVISSGITRKAFYLNRSILKGGNYFIVIENGKSIIAEKILVLY